MLSEPVTAEKALVGEGTREGRMAVAGSEREKRAESFLS